MPDTMTHLLVARKVSQNASLSFYIGSVAPDAVKDRTEKDISHFRNTPNRGATLKELALKVNGNDYLRGFVLHLFTDWKWDETIIAGFAKKEGDGWFEKYRDELSKAASYAFHSTEWSTNLVEQMILCDDYDFVETEFITKDKLKLRMQEQYAWSVANNMGPSIAFPPEIVEHFVERTAQEFNEWFLR